MTKAQALKEAKRRWGKRAMIEQRPRSQMCNGHVLNGPFKVGRVVGLFFCIYGSGSSWEHALADVTNHWP